LVHVYIVNQLFDLVDVITDATRVVNDYYFGAHTFTCVFTGSWSQCLNSLCFCICFVLSVVNFSLVLLLLILKTFAVILTKDL